MDQSFRISNKDDNLYKQGKVGTGFAGEARNAQFSIFLDTRTRARTQVREGLGLAVLQRSRKGVFIADDYLKCKQTDALLSLTHGCGCCCFRRCLCRSMASGCCGTAAGPRCMTPPTWDMHGK